MLHFDFRIFVLVAIALTSGTFSHSETASADHREALPGGQASDELLSMLQIRFGIPIKISCDADSQHAAKSAFDAAFAEAKRLDGVFSDYDPDSEARRLASMPTNQWHAASADLIEVCRAARGVTEASGGAFDISVGPLTHLWRKTIRFKRFPDSGVLQTQLAKVGSDRWTLSDDSVLFREDGMRLDFGGIAKGYALDRMALVLRQNGIGRYLIDAGGDLICGDPPRGRDHWRIEIERPKSSSTNDNHDPSVTPGPMVLEMANRSVATSGASYQSVTLEGKRYSHIVDPRTGYGVPFLANVTVEAETGMLADALASAISVLGAARSKVLLSNYNGVRFTITQQDGKRITHAFDAEPAVDGGRTIHRGDDGL